MEKENLSKKQLKEKEKLEKKQQKLNKKVKPQKNDKHIKGGKQPDIKEPVKDDDSLFGTENQDTAAADQAVQEDAVIVEQAKDSDVQLKSDKELFDDDAIEYEIVEETHKEEIIITERSGGDDQPIAMGSVGEKPIILGIDDEKPIVLGGGDEKPIILDSDDEKPIILGGNDESGNDGQPIILGGGDGEQPIVLGDKGQDDVQEQEDDDEQLAYSYKFMCGDGVLDALGKTVRAQIKDGTVTVLINGSLYSSIGYKIKRLLQQEGFNVEINIYDDGIRNEVKLCDKVVSQVKGVTKLLVGAGKKMADITRYVADVFDIPYILVADSPSSNSYMFSTSCVLTDGVKGYYKASYPAAVLADLDILATRPQDELAAGFGAVMTSALGVFEWYCLHKTDGIFYDEKLAKAVLDNIDNCLGAAGLIINGEKAGVKRLMDCLNTVAVCSAKLPEEINMYGSAALCVDAFEMYSSRNFYAKRMYGELLMVSFGAVIKRLTALIDNKPDHKILKNYNERRNVLDALLGINNENKEDWEVLPTNEKTSQFRHKLIENKDSIRQRFAELKEHYEYALPLFKRIYDDIGYWQLDFMKQRFDSIVNISTELKGSQTLLKFMRDMAMLEEFK